MIGYWIHPLAECDIREAAHYFESLSPGLGKQFRLSIEAAITLLRRHPEIAPVLSGNLRCKRMPRFKYNVIYAFENDQINVYVVISQFRRPESWTERTRDASGR